MVTGLFRAGPIGQALEGVASLARKQEVRQLPSVAQAVRDPEAMAIEEAEVERDVVADQRRPAHEGGEGRRDRGEAGGVSQIVVGDAGQPGDERVQAAARVDEGLERVKRLGASKPDRADFDDLVLVARKARGLEVQSDPRLVEEGRAGRKERHRPVW